VSFLQESKSKVGKLESGLYSFGQQAFAGNFAQGGLAAYAFSPQGTRPWGSTHRGSSEYFERLERMAAKNPRVGEFIGKERGLAAKGKLGGKGGGIGGAALGSAFVAYAAFAESGGPKEKATAAAGAMAGNVGWRVGSNVGRSVGAGIGSAILPGIGTALGAGVGWLVGSFGGYALGDVLVRGTVGQLDKVVETSRRSRKFNWVGDNTAFTGAKASTMRQMSLQLMNQGMMSARSGLGQEGMMLHR
jgi:hypothetical protein